MRCHSEDGKLLWFVPLTHNGGVYSIALSPRFIATGGADASLRLWDSETRRVIAESVARTRSAHVRDTSPACPVGASSPSLASTASATA